MAGLVQAELTTGSNEMDTSVIDTRGGRFAGTPTKEMVEDEDSLFLLMQGRGRTSSEWLHKLLLEGADPNAILASGDGVRPGDGVLAAIVHMGVPQGEPAIKATLGTLAGGRWRVGPGGDEQLRLQVARECAAEHNVLGTDTASRGDGYASAYLRWQVRTGREQTRVEAMRTELAQRRKYWHEHPEEVTEEERVWRTGTVEEASRCYALLGKGSLDRPEERRWERWAGMAVERRKRAEEARVRAGEAAG